MARYIDAEQFRGKHEVAEVNGKLSSVILYADIVYAPTADVVPKSEVDNLEYKLLGVMHSVDKWLEGNELEQDEVNRAATMREKTLQIVENAKQEVAREIFEEIENIVKAPHSVGFCLTAPLNKALKEYNEDIREEKLYYINKLKKKYTEEKT